MIDREGFKQIAEVMAKVRPAHGDKAMDQWEHTIHLLADKLNSLSISDCDLFINRCRDA